MERKYLGRNVVFSAYDISFYANSEWTRAYFFVVVLFYGARGEDVRAVSPNGGSVKKRQAQIFVGFRLTA